MSPTATRSCLLVLLLAASPRAGADRKQVFSIQGTTSGDKGAQMAAELKKTSGVKSARFDATRAELTVKLADGVGDEVVTAAAERFGLKVVAGPAQGSYRAGDPYPPDADVVTLSKSGEMVGPLPKLRVSGKYTVFDFYADWCGPCRLVDARLRQILAERKDVAVRKLNVVDFDTPLAREMGPGLDALPHVIVFTPSGKRTVITGIDFAKLDKALREP